ncbi:ribonuclease H [Sesbania bispinosa]|nr:ribonuclease H [Sesbania bispinosa]
MPKVNPYYRESSLWKGITKSWRYVQSGIIWNIGNGLSTNFWSDSFIHGLGPLSNHIINPILEILVNAKVVDLVTNGVWNLQVIQDLLPAEIIEKLHVVAPPREIPMMGIFI